MTDRHRILRRQLRRAGCTDDAPPTAEQWRRLLDMVSSAYETADEDRYTLERSLELSSDEMEALHRHVSAEHDRLHRLLGGLSEAVLQVSPAGEIQWANPAAHRLLGPELVGQPFDAAVPLVAGTRADPLGASRLAAGAARRISDATLLLDPALPVEVSVSPFDESGAIVVGMSDLTEIVQTRADLWTARQETEAARLAEKAKSMFLANMSHELRTPLNAIIGYSELLAEDLADAQNTEWSADLTRIESAGRHLLALINDILDLSKIEAGRVELFREQVDLTEWAEAIGAEVLPLMATNENKLVLDLPSASEVGWIDAFRLKQCALNLLGNAAKFTHSGTVTFRMRLDQGQLALTVADTGIGMTEAQLDAVFDEFTQAEADTTRKYGGTGLGLTLTRRLIELMGGEILAASTPDQGSSFTLSLNAALPEAQLANRTFHPSGRDLGLTVLVIDDDPAVHDLFGRHLSREGYTVLTAPGGADGLALALERLPDAITLDVMMPELDGWSVLGELRRNPATRQIPVVLVTMVEERQKGFSLGADGYLSKPVSGRQLVQTLERHGLAPHRASTILVVDDDPVVRRVLQTALTRSGYAVLEACDGEEGLAVLGAHHPDVVLLDLMMPRLDGFGFLRQLREDDTLPDVPVFVLTAADLDDLERSWLDQRVATIIAKSATSVDEVLHRLGRQLERAGDTRSVG